MRQGTRPRSEPDVLLADVFNLFNELRATSCDQNTQLTGGATNPDFGKPVNTPLYGSPGQFQAPLSLRLGVRFVF